MKYALDTNIVTRLLSGDERVLAHLVEVAPATSHSLLVRAEHPGDEPTCRGMED